MTGLQPAPVPPERIVGESLVLLCWDPTAAALMKDAIDASLPELREWMDWASTGSADLEDVRARLARGREDFQEGTEFLYMILDPEEREVRGSVGVHARAEPDVLEIGYWIRSDRTGDGFGTEAARIMTRVALGILGAHRVVIQCDPLNTRSAAIPRRLGYDLRETLRANATNPQGSLRDTMVWEMTSDRLEGLKEEERE